jgi:hypothetical protein
MFNRKAVLNDLCVTLYNKVQNDVFVYCAVNTATVRNIECFRAYGVFHSYSELFLVHIFYKHEAKFKIRENAVLKTVPMLTI